MRVRALPALLSLATAVAVATVLTGTAFAASHGTGKSAANASAGAQSPKREPSRPPRPEPSKPTSKPTASQGRPEPGGPASPKPTAKPSQAAEPFAVTGILSAVDLSAFTVTVHTKDATVVIPVSRSAPVQLDDATSVLSALPVGAHVAVFGVVSGTTRTATRINASDRTESPSPRPSPSTGTESPSAGPTVKV